MRKIILSLNITEDGFIAGANGELDWHLPFWDSEMCESLGQLLSTTDTILLGRHTYTALAAYWPNRLADLHLAREDIALAEIMNKYTKLVVSSTVNVLGWSNSSILSGSLKSEIETLKRQQGGDMIMLGSCTLAAALVEYKLVDEFHLWIHPIIIKQGRCLSKLNAIRKLQPFYTQYFNSGVTKCVYLADIM